MCHVVVFWVIGRGYMDILAHPHTVKYDGYFHGIVSVNFIVAIPRGISDLIQPLNRNLLLHYLLTGVGTIFFLPIQSLTVEFY